MTSPSATTTSPLLEVLKLHPNAAANKGHLAYLVKLTDECLTALNNANKSGIPIKLKLEAQVILNLPLIQVTGFLAFSFTKYS